MIDKLDTWLASELKARGWSSRELARRSGLSHAAISNALNGTNPSHELLDGVARAFGLTRREVYMRAGRIEPEPDESTPSAREVLRYVSALNDEHRKDVIEHAKALYALERNQRPYNAGNSDRQVEPV